MMTKKERIQNVFIDLQYADTDWSYAADLFVRWNIENSFKTESFESFVNWIDESQIDENWGFFYGYGDDCKKFAADWVEEDEKGSYLEFVSQYV
ncbi:hypothetical protein P9850_12155 [Anoxybacillus rupiensis]|uniref:Uncharacterized protein n=1 Tax=Anoxybacteroides rupiense TaxID=311460 RepID=A0ABD5IXU8_9BACL|nr:hypothetical protein [Anoxybacillus rupiensis]